MSASLASGSGCEPLYACVLGVGLQPEGRSVSLFCPSVGIGDICCPMWLCHRVPSIPALLAPEGPLGSPSLTAADRSCLRVVQLVVLPHAAQHYV